MKEYLQAANALEAEDFEPEIFESSDRKSSYVDDGWEADLERKLAAERLSQTLDFGAHQPAPPLSPPGYNVPVAAPSISAPAPAVLSSQPRAQVPANTTSVEQMGRPQSYTRLVSTLPTLGKNAPWKGSDSEKDDVDGAYLGLRL